MEIRQTPNEFDALKEELEDVSSTNLQRIISHSGVLNRKLMEAVEQGDPGAAELAAHQELIHQAAVSVFGKRNSLAA